MNVTLTVRVTAVERSIPLQNFGGIEIDGPPENHIVYGTLENGQSISFRVDRATAEQIERDFSK